MTSIDNITIPSFGKVGVACGFLSLCVLYYCWTWTDELGGMGGDNAYYLLIAEYLSPYAKPSLVAEYFAKHNPYPPLFPLALAWTGAYGHLLVAHAVTTSFLLLAFLALYIWLRYEDFSRLHAGLVCLLFAFLPSTYMQALSIHSENLYLWLSLVGIILSLVAVNQNRPSLLWLAAVFVAAASMTRSAGISLIAAFVIYLWASHSVNRFFLSLLAMWPMGLWHFFGLSKDAHYSNILTDKYSSEITIKMGQQIRIEADALWHGWMGVFTTGSRVAVVVVGIVGIVCLAGATVRVRAGKIDGVYVLFYLSLILLWPFPAEAQRLLFVVTPILLVQGLILLRGIQRRVYPCSRFSILPGLAVGVMALLSLPDLLLTTQRFIEPMPADLQAYKHHIYWYQNNKYLAAEELRFYDSVINGTRSIGHTVPEADCVYSIKPSILGFYGRRISVSPPRQALDTNAFNEALKKDGCKYQYLLPFSSPSFSVAFYPLDRIHNDIVSMEVYRLRNNESATIVGILSKTR